MPFSYVSFHIRHLAAPRPYPDDHALARRFKVSLNGDRPPPGVPSTCHAPLEAILQPGASTWHMPTATPLPPPPSYGSQLHLRQPPSLFGNHLPYLATTFLIWQVTRCGSPRGGRTTRRRWPVTRRRSRSASAPTAHSCSNIASGLLLLSLRLRRKQYSIVRKYRRCCVVGAAINSSRPLCCSAG